MLELTKDVDLRQWDSPGFFRLITCWQEDEMDSYKKYSDSFVGTRHSYREVERRNDSIGVYVLYFRSTSRFYIGSSQHLSKRISTHLTNLRKNTHHNSRMMRAFKINHERLPEILFIFTDNKDLARKVEQCLIDLLFMDPYCLNQRRMVEEYRPATTSTREKLSTAAKKQWANKAFRQKIARVYKDPTVIAKKSASGKRAVLDPSYIKKLSDASKRLWKDPGYIAGQRKSGSDVWKTPGFRERHRAAMRAKWEDPEFRLTITKFSEARARSITIDGKTYRTVKEAARILGISQSTARRRRDKT